MAPALQTTDPTTHQFAQSHPNQHVVPIHDGTYGNHATVVDDDDTDAGEDPSAIMRKLMKGKDKEWDAVTSTKSSGKKLTLLELPVDVLRLIIKEASPDGPLLPRPPADSCACRSPTRTTSRLSP